MCGKLTEHGQICYTSEIRMITTESYDLDVLAYCGRQKCDTNASQGRIKEHGG